MNHTAKLDEVLEALDAIGEYYGEPVAGTWPAFWSGRDYHAGDLGGPLVRIYTEDDGLVLLQIQNGIEISRARFSEAFPVAVVAAALEALILSILTDVDA